ncbi:hypothetical protein Clacol_008247 [Clathrus columnatus]|uniref:LisH domain-containing protein n=1 Tax=Clathrus columnatus TaxID=1419009 RepID=A0AAV5AQ15_9AGAM|nr:hypothetical protein Clacol_008247 [Clathrus columnatus]
MTVSLRFVRHRFAKAVQFLNTVANDEAITLEDEQDPQIIHAIWTYLQSKSLLSDAFVSYLPKPGEKPDFRIKGHILPLPPSGWVPPTFMRLKKEEIYASNQILDVKNNHQDTPLWLEDDSTDIHVTTTTVSKTTGLSSPLNDLDPSRDKKRIKKNRTPRFSRTSRARSEAIRRGSSRRSVQTTSSRTANSSVQNPRNVSRSPSIIRRRNTSVHPKTSSSTPRRSTRFSTVQSPLTKPDAPVKRSISPAESRRQKRAKISTGEKQSNLHDPEIPGLPWQALTSTMRERALGYLTRNKIHRQPAQCARCIQQTAAREKIEEECIAMFDSQGNSIACFRCGYRQLTCSFANGTLIAEIPFDVESPELPQSSTTQGLKSPTKGNLTTSVQQSMIEIEPGTSRYSQGIEEQGTTDISIGSVDIDMIRQRSLDLTHSHSDETPATNKDSESSNRDIELVESQVQVASISPNSISSSRSNFIDIDNEIPSIDFGGSLASVLKESLVPSSRRSVLKTYSRTDRTTAASENELDFADSDHLYTLRPAFSPDELDLPDIDVIETSSQQRLETSFRSMQLCPSRKLPRPTRDDKIHDSVHHFRAVLHTHQGIISMRNHIISLLHANDFALRHSRQSLLNATRQLKQHPLPWDIPNESPFDGLEELANDLVYAWTNGLTEENAYECIQKYDRSHLEVDRHALDPVEEKLDPYYYPNVVTDWSLQDKEAVE